MSLTRKLMLAVSLLVISLLAGNVIIGIANSRLSLDEQMQALTEDAATSLGFSLSHVDLDQDSALVNTMVDAIFDRGFYRSIVVTNTQNEIVVARSRDIRIEDVPVWFTRAIDLPKHAGVAEVISGWYRKGEVTIIAHPGYLYRELWRIFKEQMWFMLFIVVLSYGMAGLGLKYLLAPLASIRRHAEAIGRREFFEQSSVPGTIELRQIVESMNYMVRKIRDMYQGQVDLTDSFRREASMDALTQLPNREEFDRQMSSWLKSHQGGGPGALMLVHVPQLASQNDAVGREHVNALLCGIADVLKQALGTWPRALASRRTGGDFTLFIPGLLLGELESFVKQFDQKMDSLLVNLQMENVHIFIGAVGSTYIDDKTGILSAADAVLRQAISQGKPRWCIDNADNHALLCLTSRAWVDKIKQAQVDKVLGFEYQAVYRRDKSILHYEAFARIHDERKIVNAGIFWPIAERFHLVEALDRHMLKLALTELQNNKELKLAVNLSPQSVQNDEFRQWLNQTLTANPNVTRLSLELPERILRMREDDLLALLQITNAQGVGVGLDHFGLVPSALGCLQKMPLKYVKIDQQFVQDYEQQAYYLKTLCQIARACEIEVIIEGVESEAQWLAALDAGAYGGQGYWLAHPSGLHQADL